MIVAVSYTHLTSSLGVMIPGKKKVQNFANVLFAGCDGIAQTGQDAEFTVRYDGSDEDVTVIRPGNSFVFEGASFTLNDVFTVDPCLLYTSQMPGCNLSGKLGHECQVFSRWQF